MGEFDAVLCFDGTATPQGMGKEATHEDATPERDVRLGESDDDRDIPHENPHQPAASSFAPTPTAAAGKKNGVPTRVSGGRCAQPKKVVADYDSDDGRIIWLKQQGYSDEYVAKRLAAEDRIRYVPKTIGSRWLRLRRTLEEKEEEMLDDELSDWHEGEDGKLKECLDAVNGKLQKDIEKLRSRVWGDVSANLADRLQKRKYTATACQERYEAVQNGTALLPIELDPDQVGRAIMRTGRIAQAKLVRAEQRAAAKREEEEKAWQRDASKRAKAEKETLRVQENARREADKAENERIKDERRIDQEKRKGLRAEKRVKWSRETYWEQKRRGTERAVLDRMLGVSSATRRRQARKKAAATVEESESEIEYDGDEDDYTSEDSDPPPDTGSAAAGCKKRRLTNSSDISIKSSMKQKSIPVPVDVRVTKATLENPRSIMTDAELEILLCSRSLPRRWANETHPQVVARLAAVDNMLNTADLNDLLKEIFEPTTGHKAEKVRRLQEFDAKHSAVGQQGLKSTSLHFKKRYEGYKGEFWGLVAEGTEESVGGVGEGGFEDIGIPNAAA